MGGGKGMEKGGSGGSSKAAAAKFSNGERSGDSTLKSTTTCARTGRTVTSLVVVLTMVAFTTWVCVVYTTKLRSLQDRVTSLETQCTHNQRSIQQFVEDRIDILLKEVGIHVWGNG